MEPKTVMQLPRKRVSDIPKARLLCLSVCAGSDEDACDVSVSCNGGMDSRAKMSFSTCKGFVATNQTNL